MFVLSRFESERPCCMKAENENGRSSMVRAGVLSLMVGLNGENRRLGSNPGTAYWRVSRALRLEACPWSMCPATLQPPPLGRLLRGAALFSHRTGSTPDTDMRMEHPLKTTTNQRIPQGRRANRQWPVGAVSHAFGMKAASRGCRVEPIAAAAFALPVTDAVELHWYRIPQKTYACEMWDAPILF